MLRKDYLKWSETAYAGETAPPDNPVTPLAGSWPLVYLQRDKEGNFLDPGGRKMNLPITHPSLVDFRKELRKVQHTLKTLTPEQKKIGVYYGTGVPTKQWTPVIDRLIDTYGLSPTYSARVLAAVQAAVNDTMMIVWDLKYRWDVARPNQYDQEMETILCTPRFPAYPSGHAAMSGCTEVLLSFFFPEEAKKLRKIADDDALSRLYAGVHFEADNNEGLRLGRYIGTSIVNHLKTQHDKNSKPIDEPIDDFHDAAIFPDDYQQFLPYEFPETCTSLLASKKKSASKQKSVLDSSQKNNSHAPKPLLYVKKSKE